MQRPAWVLLAIVLAGGARCQDTRPESRPDPADALLAEIDSRLYSAEREGLKAVEFTYRPTVTGPLELPAFRVRVRWEQGQKEAIEFEKPDGSAFSELPDLLKQSTGPNGEPGFRARFEQGARSLLALFRGKPYSEQFRNWRKRLETLTVNGREERTIVCSEPYSGSSRFQRVEIAIDRKNLPWRVVSVLTRPESGVDRIIEEPTWEEFDGKLLLNGKKQTAGAASDQVVIKYQRKDGLIVPTSYEKLAPGRPTETTVFENVTIRK